MSLLCIMSFCLAIPTYQCGSGRPHGQQQLLRNQGVYRLERGTFYLVGEGSLLKYTRTAACIRLLSSHLLIYVSETLVQNCQSLREQRASLNHFLAWENDWALLQSTVQQCWGGRRQCSHRGLSSGLVTTEQTHHHSSHLQRACGYLGLAWTDSQLVVGRNGPPLFIQSRCQITNSHGDKKVPKIWFLHQECCSWKVGKGNP